MAPVSELSSLPLLIKALEKLREAALHSIDHVDLRDSLLRETEKSLDLLANDAPLSARDLHALGNCVNRILGAVDVAALDGFQAGPYASHVRVCLETFESLRSEIHGTEAGTPDSAVIPAGPVGGAALPSRILVVDDEPENRELLARLLEGPAFDLTFAPDGRDALEKLEHEDYDAMLLDIEMPGLDGFEVLAQLEGKGGWHHMPIIVVTGRSGDEDAVRAIRGGAEDFLSRPIRPALLLARLNSCLEKKRLREKAFQQHFSPQLAREMARTPDLINMEPREAEVTVLFCDIRRFSTISERLGPADTIDWLSDVLGTLSDCIVDCGGVLVDYTGDEVLALWGAPKEQPDHAERALQASVAILMALPQINQRWHDKIGASTEVGIGINTGMALVGNVGTHRKFKYGALGTTVNLGSRIQEATKKLHCMIIMSQATRDKLPGNPSVRRLSKVRLRNIEAVQELFQLMSSEPESNCFQLRTGYETALKHFEAGRYPEALAVIGQLMLDNPNDGPCLHLSKRIVQAMTAAQQGEAQSSPEIWDLDNPNL